MNAARHAKQIELTRADARRGERRRCCRLICCRCRDGLPVELVDAGDYRHRATDPATGREWLVACLATRIHEAEAHK